jgi:hypothetical protein
MKIKSLFLAMLVVFSSAVVFAGKDEPRNTGLAVVPVKGSEMFKVVYKGESVGKVKFNIYDSNGRLIMAHSINGVSGFILPVNFAGLPSGEYTIELTDAFGKRTEKVILNPTRILSNVHVAKIGTEENKFLLAISNRGEQSINLRIYDGNDDLMHSETRAINGDFAQVYKLTRTSPHYTFVVTDKDGNAKTMRF